MDLLSMAEQDVRTDRVQEVDTRTDIITPTPWRSGLLIRNHAGAAQEGDVYLGYRDETVTEETAAQFLPVGAELDYADAGLSCPPGDIYSIFPSTGATLIITEWILQPTQAMIQCLREQYGIDPNARII